MWSRKRQSHQSRLLDNGTEDQNKNLLNTITNGQKTRFHSRDQKPRLVFIEEQVQTEQLREHHFTSAFLCSAWPKYLQPPTALTDMNEDETAAWVEMLGSFKGWKEARAYAWSFKTNGIAGYMLPYLSVKSLRCELNILKFGHRLEIITAIENNELTLMNPSIVSICSDAILESNKKFNESHSQRSNKWANTNLSEKEVKQWFSKIQRKTSMPFKTRKNGSSYSGSSSSEASFTYDPDPQKVGGGDIWMPKTDWILHCALTSKNNSWVKEINSNLKHQVIPLIELPPAIAGIDGEKKLDDMTKELVRGGEERLSTLFSNAKSAATASCEYKVQNDCWGSI